MQDLWINGEPVPELENAPDLFFDAIPVWTAFTQLSSSRSMGLSIGYVPYSEVTSWLDENQIFSMEERALFRRLIGVVDNAFVTKKSEKSGSGNK